MEKIDFESLKLVPGIGDKTLKDIKRTFSFEDELVEALRVDKVSLRDDVVLALKKFYGIT